ncbi:MAG TPA: integrin alpha [Planctomycetota bacterium]|nr:integrin alpha [Planctomycetota bacterium]
MGSAMARFAIVLIQCSAGAGALHAQAVLHEQSGMFPGEGLGASVALAGDVNGDGYADVLVGAPDYTLPNQTIPGRVLVLAGQSGEVLFELVGAAPGDDLGRAVAGAGDLNGDGFDDMIVGAPGADAAGTNSGLVHVLSGATGTDLYTVAGAAPSDGFGSAVASAGDVDGDGVGDLIVGAPAADPHGPSSGSARVLSGGTGATLLLITGATAYERCGASVAGAGDVDLDGHADLAVGSPNRTVGGAMVGSVRLVSGATGATLLTLDGDEAAGDFGFAVAGAGDVDGDGVPDLAVGARLDDGGAVDAGSVFIHSGATGALLRSFHGDAAGDLFGSAMFGAGDMNADGWPELIVGAPFDHCEGGNCGATAIFSGADGALLFEYHGEEGQLMGASVGGGGDLDGDGLDDIIVGLPFADSQFGAGAGLAREYSASAWLNLSLGTGGDVLALAHFSATGSLQPQQPFTLALSGVAPFAPSVLVVGLSVLNAPFKGATMVPHPDLVSAAMPANAAGELLLGGLWPAGLPADASLTMQWWSLDPDGGSGFLSSNALQADAP